MPNGSQSPHSIWISFLWMSMIDGRNLFAKVTPQSLSQTGSRMPFGFMPRLYGRLFVRPNSQS